ncbi:MAG: acyl carrier protein [Terriglobia bacterium]
MRDRIKLVMASTFGVSVVEIPADAHITDFEEWDSLRHLELMLALETEFGVDISIDVMVELLSLEAIEEFLHEEKAEALQ